jgi:hypothetical protein
VPPDIVTCSHSPYSHNVFSGLPRVW